MFRTSIPALLALLVPATAAPAQTLLQEHYGQQLSAQAGYSVAGGADFDGDGIQHVLHPMYGGAQLRGRCGREAQLWYRDPQNTSNQTTSLSDAVEFVVQP